ncbi:hypothetical protein BN975_02263 [Mycolicibacterium farcinogenes]|nr:hypothetical protein BN975_02263 [Mycolicibacterium farcinogenes]
MAHRPLAVRMGEALHHDIHPGGEIVGPAHLHVRHRGRLIADRPTEHVLELFEAVAAPGQQCGDLGIGQIGQLHLGGAAPGRESAFDLTQHGLIG